jgi:hypothetical protein
MSIESPIGRELSIDKAIASHLCNNDLRLARGLHLLFPRGAYRGILPNLINKIPSE